MQIEKKPFKIHFFISFSLFLNNNWNVIYFEFVNRKWNFDHDCEYANFYSEQLKNIFTSKWSEKIQHSLDLFIFFFLSFSLRIQILANHWNNEFYLVALSLLSYSIWLSRILKIRIYYQQTFHIKKWMK